MFLNCIWFNLSKAGLSTYSCETCFLGHSKLLDISVRSCVNICETTHWRTSQFAWWPHKWAVLSLLSAAHTVPQRWQMCFESAKRVINIYNPGRTLKKSVTSRHIFRAQVKLLNYGAWCCVDLSPLELWQVLEWQVIPLKCQTSLIFLATYKSKVLNDPSVCFSATQSFGSFQCESLSLRGFFFHPMKGFSSLSYLEPTCVL